MDISINKVGQNAVVIVTRNDGETTRAFTIGQIKDWVLEFMTIDTPTSEMDERIKIIAEVLERFELDLVDPVVKKVEASLAPRTPVGG